MSERNAPRAGRTWRQPVAVLVPAFLVGLMSVGVPAASAGGPPDPEPVHRPEDQVPHLESSLQDDAGAPTVGQVGKASTDDVTVVVEATDAATARRAVEEVGGTVESQGGELIEAVVRPRDLARLATQPGVRLVREPRPAIMDVISEGVAVTGAQTWLDDAIDGTDGTGQTVAIVDGGFDDYAARLGTELPAAVETDFSRCSGTGGSVHGTAVAEIVHDMAPGATLRLVCIENDVDFVNALDTLPAAVDIANGSIGFTLVGRGDGTGNVSAAVARARDRGVLYVAAAGNYEGSHFNGTANGDTPQNDEADFVNISPDDFLGFVVGPSSTAFVSLQWDAWPTTSQDFDMVVYNEFGTIVAGSFNDQSTGVVPQPVEFLSFTNTFAGNKTFWVAIDRWSGTAKPRLDLYFDGAVLAIEHPTSSSIANPGSSPAAFTVGAHCVDDGVAEFFSSRGPTIDGRIKPDISGPDGTSSSVYGTKFPGDTDCSSSTFFGTSAAAPHVAGAAALVREANPGVDVAELQQLLEDKAEEAGTAGDDNVYGTGRLRLGPAGSATLATPQPFTGITPVRLFDSRPGTAFPGESPSRTTPIGPGGKVKVQVRNLVGVPADATAVVLNVTAVTPTAKGFVTIHPGGTVPLASNINFAVGQTIGVHVTATVGADHKVELVNAVGNTHLVVDIAGWYGPTGSGGPSTDLLNLLPVPARALDSRALDPQGYAEVDFGPSGRTTPIPAGGDLPIRVAGLGGVPADATAVVMNVAAVTPTKRTFFIAYPNGQPRPLTSSLNVEAGQNIANLVVMPVGTGGVVRFFNNTGSAHIVVDVIGWFEPGTGAGYVALDPPTRNLDTRTGNGLRKTPLGQGGTHKLKVAHYNGVPADAAAVMLSVAAVTPTATSGWLTIYPGSASLPNTANLNFLKGLNISNAVVAGLGSDGTVAITNARGTTHVVSDLAGFFIDPDDIPVPGP